jgi:hypothetical protein
MSGWNLLAIGPFLSMEVLCGFIKVMENVGIIGDRAGQLGETENAGCVVFPIVVLSVVVIAVPCVGHLKYEH